MRTPRKGHWYDPDTTLTRLADGAMENLDMYVLVMLLNIDLLLCCIVTWI